jgi:diaminopimelate decarboxylase
MTAFAYRSGALHADAVPLQDIADAVGTPAYCYSAGAVESAYRDLAAALDGLPVSICYAVKANDNLAMIRLLASLGAGADVVSEGELRRALAAGVPPERIVLSGVGKSIAEMQLAIETGIRSINVESVPELRALGALAARLGARPKVVLRINPDIDAATHDKIATGRAADKFGIAIDAAPAAFAEAAAMPALDVAGVAMHIGSQLIGLDPYRAAFAKLARLVADLRAAGHEIRDLDLGGGLGIRYRDETPPSLSDYAAVLRQTVGDLGCNLVVEPGRYLVGNAGVLLTRVLYVKESAARRFVIVDAAMNDLIRPALYGAWHDIVPVVEPTAPPRPVDIVGPVCETGDTFARERPLPPVEPGTLLAICSTGAYCAVMASTYNARPLVPEVLVRDGRFDVIRPRLGHAELIDRDRIPDWLAPAAQESGDDGNRQTGGKDG